MLSCNSVIIYLQLVAGEAGPGGQGRVPPLQGGDEQAEGRRADGVRGARFGAGAWTFVDLVASNCTKRTVPCDTVCLAAGAS